MKERKRWREIPEMMLVVMGWLLIPWLPRRGILWLARGLGAVGWMMSRRLREVSLANLDLAFGHEYSPAQQALIGKGAFQSFVLTLLDLFWFQINTRKRFNRYVRFTESALDLVRRTPLIGVTGHLGNWEVISMACYRYGAPVTAVAMPLKNPYVDRLLTGMRRRMGSVTVPRQGAIRGLLKSLKSERTIALVMDQNTLPSEGGMFLPFFGVPAPVSRAAAMLWQRTGIPLIVAVCTADSDGVYTIESLPVFPEKDSDLTPEAVTEQAIRHLEMLIRRHPQHWAWAYKRWRYYRPCDPQERYPFYAKPSPE